MKKYHGPAYGHKETGEVVPARRVGTKPDGNGEFVPDVGGPADLAEWQGGVFGSRRRFPPQPCWSSS